MANGKGKTFKFGKMMVNLSARGIATKDTETGEIRRHPFPWKRTPQAPVQPQEPPYDDGQYDDAQYEEYDPNQEYADYDQPEYQDDGGEYYAPEEDEYQEQPASILDEDWLMWAALVVFPPLGIWLLWRNNRFEMMIRSAISAASIIWFIILLVWLFSSMNSNSDDTQQPPVIPSASPTATATVSPSPTPSKTAIPSATETPEPAKTAIPSTGDNNGTTAQSTQVPEKVWSKIGGDYYHSKQDCTNMEGASYVPLTTAQNRGQSACPTCMAPEPIVKPTQTPLPAGSYYATPTGTWYHTDPNCQKMSNALVVSQADAMARGQIPCPTCIGSVYMTDGGENYHSNSSCRGMQNAYLTTVEKAIAAGKTACSLCMDGASTGTTGTTNTGNTGTAAGIYWYNPNGGSYYHKTSDCRGMKNAIQGSATAAENSGLQPCPTCLGGTSANAKFYMTTNGTWYHTEPNCKGMTNATRVTEATAIARGKIPCDICAGGTATGGNRVEVNTGNTGGGTTTVVQTTTKYYSTTDGENFHSSQTCRGMKNATEVSAAEIAERGQTPCPKCIGTSGTYYSTVDGTWYHKDAKCGGMKNATIVTLAMINSRKQTACPTCIGGSAANTGTKYYWANANGSYYHSKSNCTGMKNAVKVTEKDAEARGQTPCPTCVGSVYGTEDGSWYHKDKNCTGMKDAVHMTIQAAEKSGKTACPKCITGAAPTPKPGDDDADGKLYYYATRDGSYYHRESDCTGMRGAEKVSEATAKARGQKPCPECIGSVYATEDGDYYHSEPDCTGMRGASLVTIDTAELRGQSPCPHCLDGDGDAPTAGNTGNAGNTGTEDDLDNVMVYCTLTGRKYHSQQYCSGMAYAGLVPLSWALDPAYEPCTKCNPPKAGTVDEDETMVYCTLGGDFYHANKNCSGMRKAVDVPLSWALDPDFEPCRECDPPTV